MGGASQFVLSNGGHIQAILNPPGNPKASYLTSDELPADRGRVEAERVRDAGIVVDALARLARRPLGTTRPRPRAHAATPATGASTRRRDGTSTS